MVPKSSKWGGWVPVSAASTPPIDLRPGHLIMTLLSSAAGALRNMAGREFLLSSHLKGVLMKTTLLAATAVIALTAGAATGATTHPAVEVHGLTLHPHAVPPGTLYNQNSSSNGGGFDSQNFTSGTYSSAYNSAGADDFSLSAKHKMTGADASGVFFNGSGPANGAVATLYTGGSVPKSVIATGASTGSGPAFHAKIKHKLKAGKHYWISVVANCSFTGGCGEWGWLVRSVANNKLAVWENPGGGFGTACTTWKPVGNCTSFSTYQNVDFLFDITGK